MVIEIVNWNNTNNFFVNPSFATHGVSKDPMNLNGDLIVLWIRIYPKQD